MRSLVLMLAGAACCAAQPVISGVTSAADYTGRMSPGMIASIFGSGFTTAAPAGAGLIPLPLILSGVTVAVDGVPAPLFYVSPTQINFQVPFETAVGTASLTIESSTDETATASLTMVAASPGIFQYGTSRAVAVNYPSTLNADASPVTAGQLLVVYLNGIGAVTNQPADGDGSPSNPLAAASSTYSASLGGVDAPVSFLGFTPGLVGLAQANIQVPALPDGDYPLTITVDNNSSVSAIVSVSGAGTPPPSVLTYLSTVGVPNSAIQPTNLTSGYVQTNGAYVYVCGSSEITAIDVSNPQAPVIAGSFGSSSLNGAGTNCTIDQNYLVEIVNGNAFVVFDLTTSPANPQLIAGPVSLPINYSGSVVFDGNTGVFDTTYLTWSTVSFQILGESGNVELFDFANFAAPAYAGAFSPPSNYTGTTTPRFGMADLGNQYVVVTGTTNDGVTGGGAPTSGEGLFTVVDVNNPANPAAVSEVLAPGTVVLHDVALDGTSALITGNTQAWNNPVPYNGPNAEILNDGNLTLSFVDFTNPLSPQILATTVTNFQASSVCRSISLGGGFFAIAIAPPITDYAGAATLALVDGRNAATPAIYPLAVIDGLVSLGVSGSYLFATTSQGLNAYAITLP